MFLYSRQVLSFGEYCKMRREIFHSIVFVCACECAQLTDPECTSSQKWSRFHNLRPVSIDLALELLKTESPDSCVLGWITACIVTQACEFEARMGKVPFMTLMGTDWPVFDLLALDWRRRLHQGALSKECDDQEHPSLEWSSYRSIIVSSITSGHYTALNRLLEEVNGVAWKAASSATTSSGETISALVNKCFHGVSITALLRIWGILLSPFGDAERIVEGLSVYGEVWKNNIGAALTTEWSILPVLRLLKNSRYYTSPPRNPIFKSIPLQSRIIVVLNTHTDPSEVSALLHPYAKLGLIRHVLVLPLSEAAESACSVNTTPAWTCGPFLSSDPFVTKVLVLHELLAQKSVEQVVMLVDTVLPVGNVFVGEDIDIALPEEVYSRSFEFHTIVTKNTAASRQLVQILLDWVYAYPFAVERGGMLYLLQHDDAFVKAPEYSFLPKPDSIPKMKIRILDSVGTVASWFHRRSWTALHVGEGAQLDLEQKLELTMNSEYQRLLVDHRGGRRFDKEFNEGILAPSRERLNSSKCVNDMYLDNIPDIPLGALGFIPADFEHHTYITHISFAQNCCEKDQRVCSESAVSVGGANNSVSLKGDFLDEGFVSRNMHVLEVDRSAMMAGKTPSSQKGYYVWKPYVILKYILRLDVPWNGVVVYTDAGMVFTDSMRPLLVKYLAVSDIVATQTVMMEGHVTKRDVFVALQTDDLSAVLSNQIASCFIAVRKTPRVIEFLRWWLAACGCLHIVGEQENVYGYPNYDGFRFNNDDQSPLSVLMKKFGYSATHHSEMRSFLEARRNIAKFTAAADSFALTGSTASPETYMHAADSLN